MFIYSGPFCQQTSGWVLGSNSGGGQGFFPMKSQSKPTCMVILLCNFGIIGILRVSCTLFQMARGLIIDIGIKKTLKQISLGHQAEIRPSIRSQRRPNYFTACLGFSCVVDEKLFCILLYWSEVNSNQLVHAYLNLLLTVTVWVNRSFSL